MGDYLANAVAQLVCGIALVCVDLDDNSFVEFWCMLGLVLFRVVGMDPVGHVSRHKHAFGENLVALACVDA